MNENLKKMLDESIETEFKNLKSLPDAGKSEAVDDLAKLYRLKLDVDKTEAEIKDKEEKRIEEQNQNAFEGRIREKEAKERWVDRAVRIGTVIFEVGVPLVFYGVWMKQGFKFEENGTFTSTTFRNLISKFRPKK